MQKEKKKKIEKKKAEFVQFTLNERIRIEIKYREGRSLRELAEHLGNGRTA